MSPVTPLDDLEKETFLNLSGFETLVVQPVALLGVGDVINTYKILLGKTKRGWFEILKHILKDDTKMHLKKECVTVQTVFVSFRVKWALVKVVDLLCNKVQKNLSLCRA